MKVTEKKLGNGQIKLECLASTADVARAYALAHNAFAQQMGLAPQKGKTVEQCAKEQLGIRDLDAIVQTDVVQYLVPFALDKRNIVPAFMPKPHINGQPRRGQTFTFTLQVRPKPEYELTSYDPVTITVKPFTFDESLVDDELHHLAENYAAFEADEPHPVGPADSLKLAMEATQNGEPLKSLNTDGRTYIMGEHMMPSGFEEGLLGMNVGETKSFSFGFDEQPEGDEPETIDCTVTVLEMQRRVVPEITDEWVKKNLPMFGSVERLRQAAGGKMKQEAREEYDNMLLGAAVQELAKRFEGRIDDEIYEESRRSLMANMRGSLAQQGIDYEQFVESQGGEQQFGMMLMLQTRTNLVQGYSLDALYRHEHLEISDADLTTAAKTLNPQNPSSARRSMEESGQGFTLRELAQRQVANKWLLEHATVIEA